MDDTIRVSIHEAGHALAAIQRGMPLIDVTIHQTPHVFDGARHLERADGKVRLDPERLQAMRAHESTFARDLFEFAIAGRTAEQEILGRDRPGGARGDLRQFWGWTKGRSFQTTAEYADVLGESLESAPGRMRLWGFRHREDIDLIAAALRDANCLTRDEVVALLQGAVDHSRSQESKHATVMSRHVARSANPPGSVGQSPAH